MYEEQKMEYDRVKFPNEMIATFVMSSLETTNSLPAGTLIASGTDGRGFVSSLPNENMTEQVVVVLVDKWEKSKGLEVKAIFGGCVDAEFLKVHTSEGDSRLIDSYHSAAVINQLLSLYKTNFFAEQTI